MYEEGEKLWLVLSRRHGGGREVTVTKVGRKWVTLDTGDRFDKNTGLLDGWGYTPMGWSYKTIKVGDVTIVPAGANPYTDHSITGIDRENKLTDFAEGVLDREWEVWYAPADGGARRLEDDSEIAW